MCYLSSDTAKGASKESNPCTTYDCNCTSSNQRKRKIDSRTSNGSRYGAL